MHVKSILKGILVAVALMLISNNLKAQDSCSFVIQVGPDIEIALGDSIQLELLVNIPFSNIESVLWEPESGLDCTGCFDPFVTAIEDICYTVSVTDVNECTVMDTICVFVQSTSTQNLNIADQIELYPNLTNHEITVDSDQYQITDFKIYNSNGQLVLSMRQSNDLPQSIDLSRLIAGIYYVNIEVEEKYFTTKRFVKY